MHEMSIAEALIAQLRQLMRNRSGRLKSLLVRAPEMAAINESALRFAFESLVAGTELANAELQLQVQPISARCIDCGCVFALMDNDFRCPQCRGENYQMQTDAAVVLESVEIEEPTNGQV